MPRGEATREGIESLMSQTATLEVLCDEDSNDGYILGYDPGVYGVVLIAKDLDGKETGRMIAQIRAVTTKAEEDERGS